MVAGSSSKKMVAMTSLMMKEAMPWTLSSRMTAPKAPPKTMSPTTATKTQTMTTSQTQTTIARRARISAGTLRREEPERKIDRQL